MHVTAGGPCSVLKGIVKWVDVHVHCTYMYSHSPLIPKYI